MFVEKSHIPAVLGNPTERSPVESDQANVEAIFQNRHIELFGPRIQVARYCFTGDVL